MWNLFEFVLASILSQNKWIKLKPEYVDGLGDDMDLLIVGTAEKNRAR